MEIWEIKEIFGSLGFVGWFGKYWILFGNYWFVWVLLDGIIWNNWFVLEYFLVIVG